MGGGLNPVAISPPSLLRIAGTFLTLGATAFGGLAMAEPIRRQVVERRGWMSQQEFLDGLAYCQLLPGAIMVSFVTYLGQRLRRTPGAAVAAVSFILPAFLLMLVLSGLYFRYRNLGWVQSLSRGLGALVLALLFLAAWQIGRRVGRQAIDWVLMGLALVAFWQQWSFPLVFLAAGGLRAVAGRWFPLSEALTATGRAAPVPWLRLLVHSLGIALAVAGLLLCLDYFEPRLALLAAICLKIGALSFGGGMVMIPALQWEIVDHYGWLTLPEFLDGILLGFLTPGPIIILSTFVGYAIQGLLGAMTATVAAFFPAIALVLLTGPFYHRLKELPAVRPVIQGMLAALIAMLVVVLIQMGQESLRDWRDVALLVMAAAALLSGRVNLIIVAVVMSVVSLWLF